MPPKKGGKGKKGKGKVVEEKPADALTEVDKTFYELQIGDINRKLARLRNCNDELEAKNEQLISDYKKLDEDRADVITFLKKNLQIKTDETEELQERVQGLEEKRSIENKEFHSKVSELQKDFNVMREQLTSEVKLLTGKLNSLEEFRALREQLMSKFEKQEKNYEERETYYKNFMYEKEKAYILSKDKLKKEMESKLLQLSQDIHDATEIRIASSTHRVIRENIAINNELKQMLIAQEKLIAQNSVLKEKEKESRLSLKLSEGQKDKAIEKSIVQVKLIEKLTIEHGIMKEKISAIKKEEYDFEEQKLEIEVLTKELANVDAQMKSLQENLQSSLIEKDELKNKSQKTLAETEKLKAVIIDASFAIKDAVKLTEEGCLDQAQEDYTRRILLYRLLELLTPLADDKSSSVSTLSTASANYKRGDLGFVPKDTTLPKIISQKVDQEYGEVGSEMVSSTTTKPSIIQEKLGSDLSK
ncbi:cilia- and flagella-associated protein 157 [Arctopsyche grandis]|uniref:cilia- and flagella-associated protein 157 n=1 Tax=Arctopsyche grandis TaxID=121162 RepID=UPI00406D9ADC